MATVNDYLGSAEPWHEEHCVPLVKATFHGDRAAARRILEDCWKALAADTVLTADERRALEYQLHDYEVVLIDTRGTDDLREDYVRIYATIADLPPVGPLSDSVQAVLLVGLAGSTARRGYVQVDEAAMAALLARIPEEHKTPNIWYYIVAWAFHHDNLQYLEQALARQTVETTGWLDEYYWLRTNLMYQLVSGRATRLDVEKTLRGYPHAALVSEFRNLFLPRCERLGLMDDALYALLAQREAELDSTRGSSPQYTRRTAGVVKH